jgi:hypothetical protein
MHVLNHASQDKYIIVSAVSFTKAILGRRNDGPLFSPGVDALVNQQANKL